MARNLSIFNFKGQVKVAAVQAAFDELINSINKIVETYNTTDVFIQDQDYSRGGTGLGSSRYTLTIGGIKQVLEAYNGSLIGGRVFRSTSDKDEVIITDGIFMTTEKPIKIPCQILTGTGDVIYLDPDNETIARGNDGDNVPEGCIPIAYLATNHQEVSQMNDDDIYMNAHRGVQLEGIPEYQLSIKSRNMRWGIDGDNTAVHRFHGASVYRVNSGGASRITYQDLVTIAEGLARNNKGAGRAKRMHISAGPANFLFVPKGCNSPIWPKGGNHVSRTEYTAQLRKGSDQGVEDL